MKNLNIENNILPCYDDNYYFDENFVIIENSDSYLYTCYSQLSQAFNKEDFFKLDDTRLNKLIILKFLIKESNLHYSDLKNDNFNSILSYFNDLLFYTWDYNLTDYQEILEDIKLTYSKNYHSLYLRGYSQGDYNQVLVNLKEYKELNGSDFKEDDNKSFFTSCFYDSPLYGNFIISFNHLDKNYNFNLDYQDYSLDIFDLKLDTKSILNHINDNLHIKLSSVDSNIIAKRINHV